MQRSCHRSSGLAVPTAVALATLLLLIGLAATACKKAEEPSEAPPTTSTEEAAVEATPVEVPPTTPTPLAAEEITILGRSPQQVWVNGDPMVGPGDTILWKIQSGNHGLRFNVKVDCELALATMTFDPPLTALANGGCQSKPTNVVGATIVSAKVNVALARDLPYDCVIHKGDMTGTLKPK